MTVIAVYAVFADLDEADRIATCAVEERLAACVNVLSEVRSVYRWEGSIERAHEVAAIFKTTENLVDALMARIVAMHSYDVPCVEALPIDRVPASYAKFVEEGVGPSGHLST